MTEYSSKNTTVFFGPLLIQGMPGDADDVRVSFDHEGATVKAGVHDGVIVKDPRRNGTFTVKLLATGLGRNSSAALEGYYNADGRALPFVIIQKDTGKAVAGGLAQIKKNPDVSFGIEAPIQEWMFVCPRIVAQQAPETGFLDALAALVT